MAKRTKVYTTKTALSNGILVKYVDDPLSTDTPVKVYDNQSDISTYSHVSIGHIHATEKDARVKAEDMREKKMASLQKQMRELYDHEIKVISS